MARPEVEWVQAVLVELGVRAYASEIPELFLECFPELRWDAVGPLGVVPRGAEALPAHPPARPEVTP